MKAGWIISRQRNEKYSNFMSIFWKISVFNVRTPLIKNLHAFRLPFSPYQSPLIVLSYKICLSSWKFSVAGMETPTRTFDLQSEYLYMYLKKILTQELQDWKHGENSSYRNLLQEKPIQNLPARRQHFRELPLRQPCHETWGGHSW